MRAIRFGLLALAPPSDGVPYYSNGGMGYVERRSFRAQFLKDCVEIIGEETSDKCFNSCLAPGLAALGHELRAWATSYSQAQGVAHVENVWSAEGFAEDSAESKSHILFSAASWCEFWSSRGHRLEAYW